MQRREFILGKYPHVVICNGPWDMPEMKGCGNVVLSVDEFDQQMNNSDALWKCPECACGASFNDENYAAWYEEYQENNNHQSGCKYPDCEDQPILGEG